LNSVGGKYNNTSHIDYNRKKKKEEEACRVILLDVTAYIRLPDTPFSPAPSPLVFMFRVTSFKLPGNTQPKKKKNVA
jgi:hypothetical protein